MIRSKLAGLSALALVLAAGAAERSDAQSASATPVDSAPGTAHPEIWPARQYPVPQVPADEARIADLLKRMTIEEKIGQLVQADLCCVTPEDVKKYNLGSVLNGGNSGPYGDDLSPAAEVAASWPTSSTRPRSTRPTAAWAFR